MTELIAGLCEAAAIGIGAETQHYRLAGVARLQISDLVDWYYPEIFEDDFESGDTSGWSETNSP